MFPTVSLMHLYNYEIAPQPEIRAGHVAVASDQVCYRRFQSESQAIKNQEDSILGASVAMGSTRPIIIKRNLHCLGLVF